MSDHFERKAERLIRAAIKTVRFRTGKCTGEDLSEFFTDSEKRSQLITGFMPLEPEEEREAVSVTAQAILKGWIRRHHAELEPVRSIPFCPFCNRERAEDTGSTFDYWDKLGMKIIFEATDLVSHGTGGLCTRPADLVRFLKYPEKAAFLLRGCSREEQLMAAETARNILNDFLKDHPEIKPESHYDIIRLLKEESTVQKKLSR